MKIRLAYVGDANDSGSHFEFFSVVRVETNEEARIAGQTFARICEEVLDGALDYQRAVRGGGE